MENPSPRYFRKRITPTENLTFIAFMAGFDAIVALVAGLLPLSAIIVMLIVPLTSAAVCLFCKNRFVLVYLFAAMGITLAVSAWNITNTVFYLYPALLTGTCYGLLWKAKFPHSLNIFISSLLSLGLFYLSLLFLRGVTGVDMVTFLLTAIHKQDDPLAQEIFPSFAYAYSLAQVAFSHLFMESQLSRIEPTEHHEEKMEPFAAPASFLGCGLAVTLAFFHAKTAYLFLSFGIYWFLFAFYFALIKKNKPTYVFMALTFFGGWLGFAALYGVVPKGNGLALIGLPIGCLVIVCFLNYLLLRKKVNDPTIEI